MDEKGRRSVLIVDDEHSNILALTHILSPVYTVYAVNNGAGAVEAAHNFLPDIILLDILMPEMDGYAVIRELKGSKKTRDIPVVFLTAMTDPKDELKGWNYGAIDYIFKPFMRELLLKRVESHLLLETQKQQLKLYSRNLEKMVAEQTQSVYELKNAILETVAELVEHRDNITGGHIERTQSYLRLLINLLIEHDIYTEELSTWDINLVVTSSQLHDVGKISIDDSILMKPGKLTYDEFEKMKKHTSFGEKIIEKIAGKTKENSFLLHARLLAGSHHEKWDGTGYPRGLKAEAIPLQGRLMAIADVYDALTNDRPYKEAFTHEEAMGIIAGGSGTHFDPRLCEIFIKHNEMFRAPASPLQEIPV
ncbi:MAG: response regulator [Oscillospiraceae bacterium]|nr:response regulator [Oscillospiraceae bacterium]